MRRAVALLLVAAGLAACVEPPAPEGIEPPAASEAAGASAPVRVPPGKRLVGLRVDVVTPPPGLLDEQGAGVITVTRQGDPRPIRLVFVDDALAVYALDAGIYRVESIAGHDCGPIGLILSGGGTPLALGTLTLEVFGAEGAALSGRPPGLDDLDRLGGLVGAGAGTIDAEPLERRTGVSCERRLYAVSRPDVDPRFRPLSKGEIAGGIALAAILGAATGGAAAAGSGALIFTSGTGGLFLGF